MNNDGGWWVISGDSLINALRRCAEGEDPDMVYIELYANCESHEHVEGDS